MSDVAFAKAGHNIFAAAISAVAATESETWEQARAFLDIVGPKTANGKHNDRTARCQELERAIFQELGYGPSYTKIMAMANKAQSFAPEQVCSDLSFSDHEGTPERLAAIRAHYNDGRRLNRARIRAASKIFDAQEKQDARETKVIAARLAADKAHEAWTNKPSDEKLLKAKEKAEKAFEKAKEPPKSRPINVKSLVKKAERAQNLIMEFGESIENSDVDLGPEVGKAIDNLKNIVNDLN